jgi:ribonuclease HI
LTAEVFFLYTDGAARGNPGPAAIGAVLYRRSPASHNVVGELSRAIGHGTNNVAEYQAVIEGLEMAAGHGASRLVVRSDSQLLVRQLLGEYRVKSPGLRPLYQRARILLDGFEKVRIEHVRRDHNRQADRLANLAFDS